MKKTYRILRLLLVCLLLAGMAGCSSDMIKNAVDSGEELINERVLQTEAPEKEISGEEEPFLYAYQALPEEEQKIYRQLAKGMEELQEEIMLGAVSEERLPVIMNMVMIDHPEYFWTEGAYSYYTYEGADGEAQNIRVLPVYVAEKGEIAALKQQIEQKADQWLGAAEAEADTYGKIKAVYETLIRQVSYQADSPDNQNIQSVFLSGKTVCMGYAKAMQYMLNRMGIFCTLVTGTIADTGEGHAWNLVKIGEQYYYVDVTWGNPGYSQTETQGLDVYYSYLCCTDAMLAPTHAANDDIPLPTCSDETYHYYKNKGCWYASYDRNQIYQVLQEAVQQQSSVTELSFGSKEAYDQAAADLVEGTLIEEAVQGSETLSAGQQISWQIYYGGKDNLLTVVWN